MRFDSGFWSGDTLKVLARHEVRYTMAVRTNTKAVAEAVAAINEQAWVNIDYTGDGQAQVAETVYGGRRLIVRRTRLTDRRQARLWPDWRHFGFLTDLDGTAVEIDAFHRQHASIELAIRDLKEGSGLEHCPSGNFSANSAWLQCTVLAHNLIRWTATIGEPVEALTVARTVRTRILAVPARIVNRSGTLTLRAPARWPWADQFNRRLAPSEPCPPRRLTRRRPGAPPPSNTQALTTRTATTTPDKYAPTIAPATTNGPVDSLSPSRLQTRARSVVPGLGIRSRICDAVHGLHRLPTGSALPWSRSGGQTDDAASFASCCGPAS